MRAREGYFSSRTPFQRHALPCPCFWGVMRRKQRKDTFTVTQFLKYVLQFQMNTIPGILDQENKTVLLRCESSPPSGVLVGGGINQQEKWISALHRQICDNHRLPLNLFWKEEHSCKNTSQLLHKYTLQNYLQITGPSNSWTYRCTEPALLCIVGGRTVEYVCFPGTDYVIVYHAVLNSLWLSTRQEGCLFFCRACCNLESLGGRKNCTSLGCDHFGTS